MKKFSKDKKVKSQKIKLTKVINFKNLKKWREDRDKKVKNHIKSKNELFDYYYSLRGF